MRQNSAVPPSGNGPLHPESIPAELVALAECCWNNQANLITKAALQIGFSEISEKQRWNNQATLITKAAEHFGIRPSLAATLMLPVLFQAIAGAHPDRRTMKRLVNETIDKAFDDWLRTAQVGGAQ